MAKIFNKRDNTVGGMVFDSANYLFLAFYGITCILPFLYILAASFSTEGEVIRRSFYIIPETFSTEAYKYIFSSNTLIRSMWVSVQITVLGTLTNLFFTFSMAYPLSRKELAGRSLVLNMIIVTMVFGGGMIPSYIVVRTLGLLDSYWAVILPGAISTYNLMVVKSFFQELPKELEEAAMIDGCTEMGVLWRIVLPLSKPILATIGLFCAVGHWNNFFGPLLYLSDPKKWPLQVMLRQIVMLTQSAVGDASQFPPGYEPPAETTKMATIVVGVVPIMCVYPFLQKYFAKGVMIGAVKG